MERLLDLNCDPDRMNASTLAFVGDAVFSLMVREKLCCEHSFPAVRLHNIAVQAVRCEGQASFFRRIEDMLDERESVVYTRGRNSHNSHVPKNSSVADYRSATGIETLFGWLYLGGKIERLRELFEQVEFTTEMLEN